MNKKRHYFLLLAITSLCFSCNKLDIEKRDKALIETQVNIMSQNITLLEHIKKEEYSNFYSEDNIKNGFGMGKYYELSNKLSKCFDDFVKGFDSIKTEDTLKLITFYNSYSNHLKKLSVVISDSTSTFIFPKEITKNLLKYTDRNLLKHKENEPIKSFKLLLKFDFETQCLNYLRYLNPNNIICEWRKKRFYDLFIIQTNYKNNNTYYLSFKINYLTSAPEDWEIKINSVKKYMNDSLIIINNPVFFKPKIYPYESTDIPYEKGKYQITFDCYYKLPNGTIKTDECNYTYELK